MNTTPVSLLEQVRDSTNHAAWVRFVKLYTPLLYYWVRQTGFSTQESDDLVQEVFAILARKMRDFTYDKDKTFRGWLRTVALNKWRDLKRRKQLDTVPFQDSEATQAELPDAAAQFWDEEYRTHLMRRALVVMKSDFSEQCWRTVWQLVVEGKKAADIAAEQGRTVNAVHADRFRVLTRLREELRGLLD